MLHLFCSVPFYCSNPLQGICLSLAKGVSSLHLCFSHWLFLQVQTSWLCEASKLNCSKCSKFPEGQIVAVYFHYLHCLLFTLLAIYTACYLNFIFLLSQRLYFEVILTSSFPCAKIKEETCGLQSCSADFAMQNNAQQALLCRIMLSRLCYAE